MALPPISNRRCPRCGTRDVRRSHSHNLLDSAMSMFGKIAFRCRGCRGRFYAPREEPPPETDATQKDPETDEIETGPVARRDEPVETPAAAEPSAKRRFRLFGRSSAR